MNLKHVFFGLVLFFAFGLVGCNPEDAKNMSQDTAKLANSTGKALGNASLFTKINTRLSTNKGISMKGLHVDVKGSEVTLGGYVRTKAEKAKVYHLTEETTGVEKVINNLRIQPENK